MADIYFARQFYILTSNLFYSCSAGVMLGFPSVLNQALMSANSTDLHTTGAHASWIAAMNGVGGVLGCFILPAILHILGRKAVHISMSILLLIGWITITLATNIEALYAARFVQGIANAGIYIHVIIVSEYVHPCRRGYFITLKKIFITLGSLCCHAMDSIWTWRQISTFAAVLSLISMIMTLFWPESPSYLALQGRYEECEEAFKFMNGNSTESQKLLQLLLEVQTEKNVKNKNRNFRGMLKQLLLKDFQKALLIAAILTIALDLCGRYYIMAYVIQIMTDLLENKTSALYFAVGADVLILFALSTSGVIIKYFKRRTLLFSSGFLATLLMLIVSVLVYLKTVFSFSTQMLWFTALIIIFQSLIVNIGIAPATFVIIGEIFPLEHKSLGMCTIGLVFTSLYAIILKITPILTERTHLYGTYAIYGTFLGICLMFLYKIVPETKDKPLQEIEDDLNGVVRSLKEGKSLISDKS